MQGPGVDLHIKALERRWGGGKNEEENQAYAVLLGSGELRPEMRCSSHVEGHDLNILGEKWKGYFACAQWKKNLD